ncbi:MAG: hypothetical protein QM831_17280 [Kofleriaceae bacterium]
MRLLLLLALVGGCEVGRDNNQNSDPSDQGCEDDFRSLALNVVDAGGAPVAGLDHSTTFDNSPVTLVGGFVDNIDNNGMYAVFDDWMQTKLNIDPQPITVHFSLGADTLDVTAYVSDTSDYCHVQWAPMPATVVWPH